MGAQGSTPPVRASDAERDRTLRTLRDRSAEGRISADTFVRRVDRALRARHQPELAGLVDDLPPRRRVARWIVDAVAGLSAFTARLEAAWREPRIPKLVLPADGSRPLVIGRAADCDLVLSHPTVSRHHAELRRRGEHWEIVDLASRNGVRVNGWRRNEPTAVRNGDEVSFGAESVCVRTR